MHKLLLDCIAAHMQGVLATFHATTGLDHNLQKGLARQALVQTAIEPWFGPTVAIGSGFVINAAVSLGDQRGSTSSECDNVVYWPDLMPNLPLGGSSSSNSLFPIEGVAAVIEVKSNLAAEELRGAFPKLRGATRMTRMSGFMRDLEFGAVPILSDLSFPLACILAFESRVSKQTLVDELENNLDSWDLACVLGRNGGVFFSFGREGSRSIKSVDYPSDSSDHLLLVDFSVLLRDGILCNRAERQFQAFSMRPYVSPITVFPK